MTYTLPKEPVEVKNPNFISSPVRWRWQRWYDPFRRTTRDLRFYGNCSGCGRGCWAFDDGQNDPRGVLGDHAMSTIEVDVTVAGVTRTVEFTACFNCANYHAIYDRIVRDYTTGSSLIHTPINWPTGVKP